MPGSKEWPVNVAFKSLLGPVIRCWRMEEFRPPACGECFIVDGEVHLALYDFSVPREIVEPAGVRLVGCSECGGIGKRWVKIPGRKG